MQKPLYDIKMWKAQDFSKEIWLSASGVKKTCYHFQSRSITSLAACNKTTGFQDHWFCTRNAGKIFISRIGAKLGKCNDPNVGGICNTVLSKYTEDRVKVDNVDNVDNVDKNIDDKRNIIFFIQGHYGETINTWLS